MSLNFPSGFVRMGWLPDSLYQHNDARKWIEQYRAFTRSPESAWSNDTG